MPKLRERILTATSDLIRAEGLSAVTTKKIAAEAGCAEGSIFRIFGDKGGLLASVLSFGLPETIALYGRVEAAAALDLRAGLVGIGDALLDFYAASYPLVGSALADRDLFTRYSRAHQEGGTGPRQAWELVHRFLQAQHERGQVRPDADLEIAALMFAGACQNAVWVRMVTGTDTLPHRGEDLAGRLADHALTGLAVRRSGAVARP